MKVILGASGQVGSVVVDKLIRAEVPVRAVVHDEKKAEVLRGQGVPVMVGDIHDASFLAECFEGADSVFLITPETTREQDVLGETRQLVESYHAAIEKSGVARVVALSSFGAHDGQGKGNLEMSYDLEHAFEKLAGERIFIRPAYYFSNWLGYLDVAEKTGELPSFYPTILKIPMVAPVEVAELVVAALQEPKGKTRIYEIEGPQHLSADEVATVFGTVLEREVRAKEIPRIQWEPTLERLGFSSSGVENFVKMTEAVVAGTSGPQGLGAKHKVGRVTLECYLRQILKEQGRVPVASKQ